MLCGIGSTGLAPVGKIPAGIERLGRTPLPVPRDGREDMPVALAGKEKEGSEGTPVPPPRERMEKEGREGTPVAPLAEGIENEGTEGIPVALTTSGELVNPPYPYSCRFSSGAPRAAVANTKAAVVNEYFMTKGLDEKV